MAEGHAHFTLNESSDDDAGGNDSQDPTEVAVNEDDEAAPRKRMRVESPKPEITRPKWSNPDPYTALPADENYNGPKKDIVQLIRKAKVDAASQHETTNGVREGIDFISFNDASEEGEASNTQSRSRSPSPRRYSPRTSRQYNRDAVTLHDQRNGTRFTKADSMSKTVNTDLRSPSTSEEGEVSDSRSSRQPNIRYREDRYPPPPGNLLDRYVPHSDASHDDRDRVRAAKGKGKLALQHIASQMDGAYDEAELSDGSMSLESSAAASSLGSPPKPSEDLVLPTDQEIANMMVGKAKGGKRKRGQQEREIGDVLPEWEATGSNDTPWHRSVQLPKNTKPGAR